MILVPKQLLSYKSYVTTLRSGISTTLNRKGYTVAWSQSISGVKSCTVSSERPPNPKKVPVGWLMGRRRSKSRFKGVSVAHVSDSNHGDASGLRLGLGAL